MHFGDPRARRAHRRVVDERHRGRGRRSGVLDALDDAAGLVQHELARLPVGARVAGLVRGVGVGVGPRGTVRVVRAVHLLHHPALGVVAPLDHPLAFPVHHREEPGMAVGRPRAVVLGVRVRDGGALERDAAGAVVHRVRAARHRVQEHVARGVHHVGVVHLAEQRPLVAGFHPGEAAVARVVGEGDLVPQVRDDPVQRPRRRRQRLRVHVLIGQPVPPRVLGAGQVPPRRRRVQVLVGLAAPVAEVADQPGRGRRRRGLVLERLEPRGVLVPAGPVLGPGTRVQTVSFLRPERGRDAVRVGGDVQALEDVRLPAKTQHALVVRDPRAVVAAQAEGRRPERQHQVRLDPRQAAVGRRHPGGVEGRQPSWTVGWPAALRIQGLVALLDGRHPHGLEQGPDG